MLKIQEIREIIRLIDQTSISEFSYEYEGSSVSIKKTHENQPSAVVETPVRDVPREAAINIPKDAKQADEQPVKPAEAVTENNTDDNVVEIVSPMVGTFYRKPSPESDTYVEIGDNVKEDSIVGIVEAMKLFNEIEAEITGEIVEILVTDGELVEYGQALFKVKSK